MGRWFKHLYRVAYRFAAVRAVVLRYGPAVRRLPPVVRRRMTFTADTRRLPGVRTWTVRPAERFRSTRLPPAVVARVPRAWLVGDHAAAVTDRGRLLTGAFHDAAGLFDPDANADLVAWLTARGWTRPDDREPWPDVCSFVSRLDPNYFHWLVHWCGQVESLETYERQTGVRPTVLIRGGGSRYLRPGLELLGVDPARLREWHAADGPRPVDRLVVCSRPGNELDASPASLHWLRRRFLSATAATPSAARRLYIPRAPGGWRSVLNEDELVARLVGDGFEVVRPDGLPLADQVRLFAQAGVIVGLHGAGLTNLLFAPHAAVVELRGSYRDEAYRGMSARLGLPYAAVPCEPVGQDVRADPDAVLRAVAAAAARRVD